MEISNHSGATHYRQSWQDLHQFQLVVPVNQTLTEALENIRQPFLKKYNAGVNKPMLQIPVAYFSATIAQSEMIMRWMGRLLKDTTAFTLWLNNFSGIPPHQLYMRVQHTAGVCQLLGQLDKLNDYLASYDLPNLRTHSKWILPVMDAMPGMLYEKALNHLARLEMGFSLPVQELLLQKQTIGAMPWALVQRFAMQPPQSSTEQPWYAPVLQYATV